MVKDGCRTSNSVRGPPLTTHCPNRKSGSKGQKNRPFPPSPKLNDCERTEVIALDFLRRVHGCLPTFRESIGPVFEGQAVQVLDCSTLEASADVVPKRQLTITNQRCVTSQKSKDINYIAAVAWNLAFFLNYLICRQRSVARHLSHY
jgi:hypothetical protein